MLDKVQSACIKALSKVDKLEIRGMPRIMVYLFLFIVIFCLLLFLTAWIWQWHDTGNAELSILIQFVNAITSVSFIAAVGFFGRAMLDKDDNGIPDEFEKQQTTTVATYSTQRSGMR